MIQHWAELKSYEIKGMDKQDALVIVPIGAIEQHGAHLPVGTDTIILDRLMKELADKRDFPGYRVLIAPLIPIGKSNEHSDFAGTISFSTRTAMAMLSEMCASMRKHGFERFIFVNSHGGNTDLLNVISRDLRIELDAEVFVFDWWFTTFWNDILEELQQSGDYGVFHACELETSLMLAIRPELVDMAKAEDEFPDAILTHGCHVSLKGPIIPGWKTSDVSSKGVIGAPTLATEEKGSLFLDYAVRKLGEMLLEVLNTRYRK
ncbi:creatininase family protein [Cohnella sp. AR92]|uniref:creatininase family protein n=1 Tax=Cohnella sp. AR92 TaxID=648716 RepID=UPI000F8E1B14|nr:creatininase family protein [Cohnella sp. AR92]RUS47077.1 creatininase family protein [Cohnella sp. AR92]